MKKYKEKSPQETIDKIINILNFLKIETSILENISDDGSYSYYISCFYNGKKIGFSNGKGTTKEFALASGLAEFMERLSNDFLKAENYFLLNKKLMEESFETNNFFVHHDEKILTIPELMSNEIILELYKTYGTVFLSFLHGKDKDAKFITLPFKNVHNDKIGYLPIYDTGISLLFGSNGMCAGNSEKEALIQGISELLERYCLIESFLYSDIDIPNIPLSILDKYPYIKKICDEFKKNNFSVQIKDLSFGGKFPVVGVIVKDLKTGKAKFNAGAFPVLHIALERCFTEILQNKNISSLSDSLENIFEMNHTTSFNMHKIFTTYNGHYPNRINYPTHFNYNLSAFIDDVNEEMSIPDIYEYLIRLLKNNNINCWFRDCSYYGFNAYQVLFSNVRGSILTTTKEKDFEYASLVFERPFLAFGEILEKKRFSEDNLKKAYEYVCEIEKQPEYVNAPTFFYTLGEGNFSFYTLHHLMEYFIAFMNNDYKLCSIIDNKISLNNFSSVVNKDIIEFYKATDLLIYFKKSDRKYDDNTLCKILSFYTKLNEKNINYLVKEPKKLFDFLCNIDYYIKNVEFEYIEFSKHLHTKEKELLKNNGG